MFDQVVVGYDCMNIVMMFGNDVLWCVVIMCVVVFKLGEWIFDFGVGIVLLLVFFVCSGVQVVVVDFLFGMFVEGE